MKRIIVLGSTGSIGTQALEILESFTGEIRPVAMSAHSNFDLLIEQADRFSPSAVCLTDRDAAGGARAAFSERGIDFYAGAEGLLEMIADVEAEQVLNALVGAAGLLPTIRTLELGMDVALANKESLVAGGRLVMETALQHESEVIPVDSEHSAIFQCLKGEDRSDLNRIIITASGGSFRDRQRQELRDVGAEEALAHPTWKMGKKVTIDSATLLNKGFEVIEAHHLFDIDYDHVEVLIHPQSVIHSLVEMSDGSLLAQMGWPDMRLPIQYALTYPRRGPAPGRFTDLTEVGDLGFEPVDKERYPCLGFAYRAGRMGGTYPAALNAADEKAVGAFLSGRIGFLDIEHVIEWVLEKHVPGREDEISEIIEAQDRARGDAREVIGRLEEGY